MYSVLLSKSQYSCAYTETPVSVYARVYGDFSYFLYEFVMKGESLTDWISPLSWEYMYSRRAKWVKIYIKQKFSMAAFPDFRIPNSPCVPNLVLGACIIWKVLNRRSPTTNINACRHVQVFFTVACKNTLGREEVKRLPVLYSVIPKLSQLLAAKLVWGREYTAAPLG